MSEKEQKVIEVIAKVLAPVLIILFVRFVLLPITASIVNFAIGY